MKTILIAVLLAFTNAKDESTDAALKTADMLGRVASDSTSATLPKAKAPAAEAAEAATDAAADADN